MRYFIYINIHATNPKLCHQIGFIWQDRTKETMVFILDGSLEHCAHTWNKPDILIGKGIRLHRKSRKIRFFSEKTDFTS